MPETKNTYKGQTDARRKATAKYLKESVEDIRIRVPKGKKAIIQSHAENQNKSLNIFVNEAIDEKMERDVSATLDASEQPNQHLPMLSRKEVLL